LLPWLGSHDLSSATVQRSSGAAAIGDLQKKKQFPAQRCCVKVEKRKAVWAERDLRLPSFSFKPAGWQARSISGDSRQSSRR
jgi:hypothetical protein